MSKGSSRRPQEVPDELVRDNWSRIFGGTLPDDIDLPTEEKGEEDGNTKHRPGG